MVTLTCKVTLNFVSQVQIILRLNNHVFCEIVVISVSSVLIKLC